MRSLRLNRDARRERLGNPDFTPYLSVVPPQSLFGRNPAVAALRVEARKAALASARTRWDMPDAAPSYRLNRPLSGSIKGWATPYPGVRQAVFAPLSLDVDGGGR